jgi:hypothetical protein
VREPAAGVNGGEGACALPRWTETRPYCSSAASAPPSKVPGHELVRCHVAAAASSGHSHVTWPRPPPSHEKGHVSPTVTTGQQPPAPPPHGSPSLGVGPSMQAAGQLG